MPIPQDLIIGNLVVKNLPETFCFTSATELIEQLPSLLGVEIPASQVSNVVVSVSQPSDSETTSIWFRVNNSGSFVGIYVFSNGAWIPIYPINDSVHIQVEWFSSTDGTAPAGWTEIEASTPGFPPGVATALAALAIPDPTATFNVYFPAYYTG